MLEFDKTTLFRKDILNHEKLLKLQTVSGIAVMCFEDLHSYI